MNQNVKKTLDIILDKFKSGDIPEAIAYSMFPFPDIPSANWSLLNRTIMILNNTMDARGLHQWNKANRYVKGGSKAFYIIVPFIKKVDSGDEDNLVLRGFGIKPVFRVEDTDGEPLQYQTLQIPDLPLIERAEQWGVSVKAIPDNFRFYGYYSPGQKEIAIATSQECVFFHELAHCAHHIYRGDLKPGQDPIQEIVAELSAQALARMVGKSAEDTTGNSYRYIEKYAEQLKLSPHEACLKVMSDTEKVMELILTGQIQDKRQPQQKAA
jgi:hypothetical protein